MIMPLITGTTTVVGVLGDPIAHSLSPVMHNAAFREVGLDWVYVPFAVPPDTLPVALSGAAALGIRGLNVTIPHKQAVIPLLDRLTPEAEAIGSVNTIAITADGLLGHSTDGPGFLRALTERGFTPRGTRVVVMGAGGAARAIICALAGAGVRELTILARHPERAAELPALATRFATEPISVNICRWDETARQAIAQAQLLVNATSIGMATHAVGESPVPSTWLHSDLWVYDLVYTPRETAFLRAAAARGCTTVDGVAMLVYQGAEAFTFWTHLPAPVTIMETAVSEQLQRQR